MDLKAINENAILRHSFEFALMVEEYFSKLIALKKFDIARQLFRAGTSIGANVFEAQHAESRADFAHKMKIASKEASETNFWLLLCQNGKDYPSVDHLIRKLNEILRLLSSIISKTKYLENAPN